MTINNSLLPSVCIDAVFGDLSIEQACAQTKQAGINTIEFWSWWDKNLDEIRQATEKHALNIACCCTKFISLVDASQRDSYLNGLQASIEAAKTLNISCLISQVGDFIPHLTKEAQRQSLINGLKAAAPILEQNNIMLVVEPLNELVDHQGYFLINSHEAFDIIKAVNSPNIKVLFDIYHQQISEGNLINNIIENIAYIGHFHAAGHPGRNELQRGEIFYPNIFSAIQQTDFRGYVGLEYWPKEKEPIHTLQEVAHWLKGNKDI